MRIYQVSREFYPYANAGGLKEVVTGIARSLVNLGHESYVFIPCYGFINKEDGFTEYITSFYICLKGIDTEIKVYYRNYHGVHVYMLGFLSVADKHDVYTYTDKDEEENFLYKRGHGFLDTERINTTFQLAFLEFITRLSEVPDVISLHDGHTGLIPALIKSNEKYYDFLKDTGLFFTIHNAGHGYHQQTHAGDLAAYGIIDEEFLKHSIIGDDVDPLCMAVDLAVPITVSPYYANELMELKHEEFSGGFGQFCRARNIIINGITNGVDIEHFKNLDVKGVPDFGIKESFKRSIEEFIRNPDKLNVYGELQLGSEPLFIFQNRITEQKGVDKLIEAVKMSLILGSKASFIVMGQGEKRFEKMLIDLAHTYPSNIAFIRGYDEVLANKLFLASDFFLLTSLWEPCGLTDFEAQLAGSIPIVHNVGGLKKVLDGETGFVYDEFNQLEYLILKCENLYKNEHSKIKEMIKTAFKLIEDNYTWDMVVEKNYIPLFEG